MPTIEPHRQRRTAESFGADAARYDRARPDYPRELVERIVALCPDPRPYVLDIGSGTGIVARQFAAAGCRVLGVDPDARMGDLARRGGVESEVAGFEDWDPAGRRFDAAVSGQAWHWIDPVAGAGRAASALRPGAPLAVFWNAVEPPAALAREFAGIYARVAPGSLLAGEPSLSAVDGYGALCARAEDGLRRAGAFAGPERWRLDWERTYGREEWLDHLRTTGGHAQLSPGQRAAVLTDVGAAIDAAGGEFTARYATLAVVAARA
ncbi:class I SAM-dependent methyltransferase [Streptomyces sp. NPDC050504]|uniref:class I SAM-dependent methyltransferase n=1 Tax=Streptomyces sp. NPDC050504 TaxID=3365618 RepID=UPI003796D41D